MNNSPEKIAARSGRKCVENVKEPSQRKMSRRPDRCWLLYISPPPQNIIFEGV
jgi:hypothetical protein